MYIYPPIKFCFPFLLFFNEIKMYVCKQTELVDNLSDRRIYYIFTF